MASLTQCPGIPELNHKCSRRVLTREICEDCERIKKTKMFPGRRCPGVPMVGHSCHLLVRRRLRCESCERIHTQHQKYLHKMKLSIKRVCLKCDREFIAKNRFLRLCDGCRSSNRSSEHAGMDETRYTISIGRG